MAYENQTQSCQSISFLSFKKMLCKQAVELKTGLPDEVNIDTEIKPCRETI